MSNLPKPLTKYDKYHVTLVSNSKNCNFSPYCILKFRKSYQIWGKLAQEQKCYRQKTNLGWKTPNHSAYRVKYQFSVVKRNIAVSVVQEMLKYRCIQKPISRTHVSIGVSSYALQDMP